MPLSNYLETASLSSEFKASISHLKLKPEETLFHQGAETQAAYVVNSGRLKLARYTPCGSLATFEVVRAGESCGDASLLTDVHTCSAIAEVETEITVYPKSHLVEVLHDDPELAKLLAQRLVKTVQLLVDNIELRSIRSARDRILQYFNFTLPPGEKVITFDRPYKDIADELGLAPEVFYRTLARLEREGAISRNRRHIELHLHLSL